MEEYITRQRHRRSCLNSFYSRSFTLLLLPYFLVDVSCNTSNKCFSGTSITIPSSDLTPPSTIMDVHRPGKSIITVTSTSNPDSANIGANDTITLIAKGTDPEGLKDIQVWVEETWWNPTQIGPGLASAPEVRNQDKAGVGDKGCTERVVTLNLYIKPRRKQSTRYKIRTWATAINHGGVKTKSSVVTLNWP